jgi:hypothetical protein
MAVWGRNMSTINRIWEVNVLHWWTKEQIPCSKTPSIYILPLRWETKFDINRKQSGSFAYFQVFFYQNWRSYYISILGIPGLCYKPEKRRYDSRWGNWISSIHLILPAAVWSWDLLSSNRSPRTSFWGVKRGRLLRLTTSLPPLSRIV